MSEIQNNIINFNYSVDPTTLMSNSWITNNTDTTQNTVTGVGEKTDTHYWRTITFDFTGKAPYAGVFRIEVDNTGVPVEPFNFESISGDEVEKLSYGSLTVNIINETLSAAGILSNFPTATENTVYTETDVAGTWSYVASTTTETEYDHYEVSLYVNSDVTTFPNNLFYSDENITSVEFDTYSITSIEDGVDKSSGAFCSCSNLASITLPDNLEYLGDCAIYDTAITSIILPSTVEEIGETGLNVYHLSITSLATVPPTIHTDSISNTTKLTISQTSLQDYINSDWGNYVRSISTIETPTYNNVLKFNYSTDPTTFLNNLWVKSCTDTKQNTIEGVGEHTEPGYMSIAELEDLSKDFDVMQQKLVNEIVAQIVADGGIEIYLTNRQQWTEAQISTFMSIYGDDSAVAYAICVVETNSYDYEDIMPFIETEVTVYDHYEITLYINSALNTFETMMFAEDTNITSVEFDYDVTYIGDDAFNGCTSLTDVTLNTMTPPELGDDVFKNVTATLYVPNGSEGAYRSVYGAYFSDIEPLSPSPVKKYGFNLSGMGNVDYVQQGAIMIK